MRAALLPLLLGASIFACGVTTPPRGSGPRISRSPTAAPAPLPTASAPRDGGRAEEAARGPFHFAFRGNVSAARLGTAVAIFSPQLLGIFEGNRLIVDRALNASLTNCGRASPTFPEIEAVLGEDPERPMAVTVTGDNQGGKRRDLVVWDGKQWKGIFEGDTHTSYAGRGAFLLSIVRSFGVSGYALRTIGGARFLPATHPRCKGSTFLSAGGLLVGKSDDVLVIGADRCDPSKGIGVERFNGKGVRGALRWFGAAPLDGDNSTYAMARAGEIWAVAEDTGFVALDLEHGSWKRIDGPSGDHVWDFAIVDSVVWVGAGKTVFRGKHGADWTALPLPRDVNPTRVIPTSDEVVWVVANEGVLTTAVDVAEGTLPVACP
jgi:hypothetical protein